MDTKEINYSIVIPHYADFEGLKRLLPTIPDRDDIQIIIVDDNSYTESSILEDTINSVGMRNIVVLYNDKNKRGAGGCRNIGIDHAEGKWLIFSDADDFFTENAFDIFDDYLESTYDIICFHMTSVNLCDETTGTRHLQYETILNRFHSKQNNRNELCIRYNLPAPWAKMIRRSLVRDNNIRFDDVKWSNDDMFSAKCGYFANTINASNKIVYCVTRDDGTITTSRSSNAIKTSVDVYIRKTLFLKEKLSYSDFRKSIRWPGNKMILACLDGYDDEVIKYILRKYKEHKISFFWFGLNDFLELYVRLKTYFYDRKYTKVSKKKG